MASLQQSGLAIQARVVGALILRESRTRFGRSQLGYLWALVEPIALVATFTLAFSALGHKPAIGNSLPLFFATGILMFTGWRRTASFCSSGLVSNQALLSFPIVQQVDTLVARMLLELLTASTAVILILGALVLVWGVPPPRDVQLVASSVLLLSLVGFGYGSIHAVISSRFESWRRIEDLLSRPMFFISGVFFIPDALPATLRYYLSWNPVLQGIELGRYGYYADYRSTVLDIPYLIGCALVLCLLALSAERVMRLRSTSDD